MKGLLKTAGRIGIPVYVPTAVLAEAYRGTPADAAIDRVLSKGTCGLGFGVCVHLALLAVTPYT
jgi:hypothetical protein